MRFAYEGKDGGSMPREMKQKPSCSGSDTVDRRKFLGTAAMTAGMMFLKPELVRGTAANSAVRVGLLGCGGRGTEDATNLVDTGGARVVALADMFQDQLDKARAHFDQIQQAKGYSSLGTSQLFVGPNAYQQIAASKELDAIVIATPPYFHPHHLEAVVAAGKHVYLEKPVAVDVPGALKVIDICNWILKAHPVKASATGGRQGRPQDGDVYGNYNAVFYYPDDVDVTFSSTQFAKGWWDVTERFFGTKGTSQSPYTGPLGIWGDEPWQSAASPAKDKPETQAFSVTGSFSSNLEFADPEKKKAFVESITNGNFHNQAAKGAESALSCMMARTAAYTGREVTWDELMKTKEVWDPKIDLNKLR